MHLFGKCRCEVFQSLLEGFPRTGGVDALEAAAARTEDGAVVEPEMRIADDFLVEFLIRKPIGGEVEPEEIRSFRLDERHLREVLREECSCACIVLFQIGEELREPRCTMLVRCLCAREPERVRLVVARAAQFLPEPAAQLRISDEDVRDLKAREVEGLARRGAGDGDRRRLIGERGERDVTEAGSHELLVNLVRDDDDVVAQADRGELLELRMRPDTSDGVVRAAQNEEFDAVRDDLLLEVLKVDLVVPLDEAEGTIDKDALVLANHVRERVVDGLLYEYSIALFRKCADGVCDGKDDTGRDDEVAALDGPVMARAEPVLKDGEIVVLHLRIAENAVCGACFQRINHRGGRAKVHIRDPERQNVCGVAALSGEVVFQTRGVLAVDDFVKIDGHMNLLVFSICASTTRTPRYASDRVLIRLNTCGLLKRATLERKKSAGGETPALLTCSTRVRLGALRFRRCFA